MKTLDQIRNEPATFGAGGGDVVSDTSNHKGPYHILKAQGGDAVIATGSLPATWTGNLNGLTVSNGDSIVLAGMHDITLTSGTLLAYKLALTPPRGGHPGGIMRTALGIGAGLPDQKPPAASAPAAPTYQRPDGTSKYLRPAGTSLYLRPS